MQFERTRKFRRQAVYAVAALLIAAGTIGAVELAGTNLTSAHSGLGGKLAPAAEIAPARATYR